MRLLKARSISTSLWSLSTVWRSMSTKKNRSALSSRMSSILQRRHWFCWSICIISELYTEIWKQKTSSSTLQRVIWNLSTLALLKILVRPRDKLNMIVLLRSVAHRVSQLLRYYCKRKQAILLTLELTLAEVKTTHPWKSTINVVEA